MLKKQIWGPDTCKCKIEQTFDYSTQPAALIESTIITACPEHTNSNNEIIVKENTDKNRLVGKIIELYPDVKPEDVPFFYDQDRNVVLLLSKQLTSQEKQDLGNELLKVTDKFSLN